VVSGTVRAGDAIRKLAAGHPSDQRSS